VAIERERSKLEAERSRRNRIITGVVLGGIIGGVVFLPLKFIVGNARPETLAPFIMIISVIVGIIFFIRNCSDSIGNGCGWGCGGIICGGGIAIIFCAIATVPLFVFIVIGVIVGVFIGLLSCI
jgi:hypothetical protein